jgi:hypothetical protein
MRIGSYAKAIVGFIAPGVVTIGGALTVNSDGGGNVTPYEWVTALIACLVTGGFVAAVPNKPYVQVDRDTVILPPGGLGLPEDLRPRPVTEHDPDRFDRP